MMSGCYNPAASLVFLALLLGACADTSDRPGGASAAAEKCLMDALKPHPNDFSGGVTSIYTFDASKASDKDAVDFLDAAGKFGFGVLPIQINTTSGILVTSAKAAMSETDLRNEIKQICKLSSPAFRLVDFEHKKVDNQEAKPI